MSKKTYFYTQGVTTDSPLTAIINLMYNRGVSEEQIAKFRRFCKVNIEDYGGQPDLQRFLINKALRTLIAGYGVDTIEIRTYLIDDGNIDDWARLFEEGVLPCMIANNSPLKTNS